MPRNTVCEVFTAVAMKSSSCWGIMQLVLWKTTEHSEDHVTSVFIDEEQGMLNTSMQEVASRGSKERCLQVSRFAYISTLKREPRQSSEMLADFQMTPYTSSQMIELLYL